MKDKMPKVVLWAACSALSVFACNNGTSDSLSGQGDPATAGGANGAAGAGANGANGPGGAAGPNGGAAGPNGGAAGAPIARVVDYGEALRSASLKLVGDLPTLADIKAIAAAATDADKKTVYEAAVDKYLADSRFADTQVTWWKNTFKTGTDPGTTPAQGMPSFDTAATFAAQVVVQDRPYTDILTAKTGTCPTYAAGGTFTAADCTNKAAVSGVLSDPGLMAQFTSNMAMRRVRFVQETFACQKFPAEVVADGKPMGAGTYTSPWDFNSIAGGTGAKIDFHDTSAVICANCHTTINHIAPLFANFDAKGLFQTTIQVQTPVTPPVTSQLGDWLAAGQGLAWRNGVAVTDLPSLGAAMAKDPAVSACAVTRVWNWALSRGDVVNDGATVPAATIADQVSAFTASGLKLKSVIRGVFTSQDFVSF